MLLHSESKTIPQWWNRDAHTHRIKPVNWPWMCPVESIFPSCSWLTPSSFLLGYLIAPWQWLPYDSTLWLAGWTPLDDGAALWRRHQSPVTQRWLSCTLVQFVQGMTTGDLSTKYSNTWQYPIIHLCRVELKCLDLQWPTGWQHINVLISTKQLIRTSWKVKWQNSCCKALAINGANTDVLPTARYPVLIAALLMEYLMPGSLAQCSILILYHASTNK